MSKFNLSSITANGTEAEGFQMSYTESVGRISNRTQTNHWNVNPTVELQDSSIMKIFTKFQPNQIT